MKYLIFILLFLTGCGNAHPQITSECKTLFRDWNNTSREWDMEWFHYGLNTGLRLDLPGIGWCTYDFMVTDTSMDVVNVTNSPGITCNGHFPYTLTCDTLYVDGEAFQ